MTVRRYRFFENDNADPDAVTQVSGVGEGDASTQVILDRQTGTGNAFHIRISFDETSGATKSGTLQLQVNYNGTGWNDVNASSSYARTFTGSALTDFITNTNLCTAGSGDWNNGVADEDDGNTGSFSMVKSDYTECMWAVYIVDADVADGLTLQFRLTAAGQFTVVNLGSGFEIETTVDKAATQYTMNAAADSFTLTGLAATLLMAAVINAAANSYAVTGADATLQAAYQLNAEAGSYAVSGAATTNTRTLIVNAEAGSYAVTGVAMTPVYGRSFNAEPGSYSTSGAATTLPFGYALNAVAGTYGVTGAAATFVVVVEVNAEPGSYALSGLPATPVAAYVLNAAAGSYAITGVLVQLPVSWMFDAGSGSYALSGIATDLDRGEIVNAVAGSYAITGAAADLTYTPGAIVLNAEPGSYALTGQPATLLMAAVINASAGSYAVTGAAVPLGDVPAGLVTLQGYVPLIQVTATRPPTQAFPGVLRSHIRYDANQPAIYHRQLESFLERLQDGGVPQAGLNLHGRWEVPTEAPQGNQPNFVMVRTSAGSSHPYVFMPGYGWSSLGSTAPHGRIFDVTHPDFGAKGDGFTDDTTAIQAAIDLAKSVLGVVLLPAGTYVVSTLTIDSRVTLVGTSRRTTVIKASGTGSGAVINVAPAGPDLVYLRDFTIDMSDTASATGIAISNMQRAALQDIYVLRGAVGIQVDTSGTCFFERLRLLDQTTSGFVLDGDGGVEHYFTDVHIEVFNVTSSIAFHVTRTTTSDRGALYFTKLRIVRSGAGVLPYGVKIDCSGGTTTIPVFMSPGCVIDGVSTTALWMINVAQTFIVGAWMTSVGGHAIVIDGASDHYIGFSNLTSIDLQNGPAAITIALNRFGGTYAINVDPASPPTILTVFDNRCVQALTNDFEVLNNASAQLAQLAPRIYTHGNANKTDTLALTCVEGSQLSAYVRTLSNGDLQFLDNAFTVIATFRNTSHAIDIKGPISVSGQSTAKLYSRDGDPEGALTAGAGSLCMNLTPASTEYALYIKRTGSGNTGWEGLGTVLP
jgi:hypothetical protein